MHLAVVLRELREAHGLSQEQAAEEIGLSDRRLRQIESGRGANATLATLVACAVAYRVEVAALFTRGAR